MVTLASRVKEKAEPRYIIYRVNLNGSRNIDVYLGPMPLGHDMGQSTYKMFLSCEDASCDRIQKTGRLN